MAGHPTLRRIQELDDVVPPVGGDEGKALTWDGVDYVHTDVGTQAEVNAHINNPTDAHDASAISFAPTGTIAATDAQTAIAEVASEAAASVAAHEADTTVIHGIADTSLLGLQPTVVTVTSNVTLAAENQIAICSGNRTVTLPPAATAVRKRIALVRTDTSTTTRIAIVPSGADLIDGQTKVVLAQANSYVELVSDGVSGWRSTSRRTAGALQTSEYGCLGNGSADDHANLQTAIIAAQAQGAWLDGAGLNHRISQPLLLPPSLKLQNITITAQPSYAPADANNAMVMNMQGAILAFTGSAATDTITTPSAHLIPSDGIKVVFQGTGLPGGLVSGRVYYAYDRTATTFKVAATLGGALIDLTSDGSGTFFGEIVSLQKLRMEHVLLDGNTVAGMNGMDVSLQQQSEIIGLRIQNCPGFGLKINGQQAEFYDLQTLRCGDGLILDNMSFLHVFGSNFEAFTTSAIRATSGGSITNCFYGTHVECVAAPDGISVFDFRASSLNTVFDSVHVSMREGSSTIVFDMGGAAVYPSYSIRGARVSGPSEDPTTVFVRDNYRGRSIKVWDDASGASANGMISELIASHVPTSAVYKGEHVGVTLWGAGGKETRMGMQQNADPNVAYAPGSAQTADIIEFWNTAKSAKTAGIRTDGSVWTPRVALGSTSGPVVISGAGSPEGVVAAPVGSKYLRSDGGANTATYRKETGAGTNTGWVADSAAGGGAGAVGSWGIPAFRSGRYYSHANGDAGGATTLNRLSFTPLFVSKVGGVAIDRIGIRVTALGVNAVFRLGAYALDPATGGPGNLLFDAGTVDATAIADREITVAQTLPEGLVWLAGVSQVAICSVQRWGTTPMYIVGHTTFSSYVAPPYLDGASGALPASAAAYIDSSNASIYNRILVRAA